MKNKLIGFAGGIESGKTTAAKYLEMRHGFLFLNFATPLKETAAKMTGLNLEYFYNFDLKRKKVPWLDMTPRKVLKVLGTECIRGHFGRDFWVKRMKQKIDLHPGQDIVIGDVRFAEEAEMITAMGGVVILLTCDTRGTVSNHASESIDFPCDFEIVNNYLSKEHLYDDIERLIDEIN